MRHGEAGLGLSICLYLLGCGGNVTVQDTAGAGATGGTAGTGAAAGEGGSTSGQAGSTSIGPGQCGGKQGLQCADNEWCDYPEDNYCGCCDAVGVCVQKPLDCPFECPGVCGCDGQFYCNDCLANLAGIEVSTNMNCVASDIEYSMYMFPTDAPRFGLFKRNPTTCVRVVAVGFGGMGPYAVDVTPPWQIESIAITNSIDDCPDSNGSFPIQPLGDTKQATAAMGSIIVDLPDIPCGATALIDIQFDGMSAWAPPTEYFDSGYLSSGLPCDL